MERNDLLGWPERWPQIFTSNHTTRHDQPAQPPEPPIAAYPVHPCPFCGRDTSYIAACSACRATKIALDFHHLREEIRNGLRSDWPLLSHISQAVDHTKHGPCAEALVWFQALMIRAARHGFTFTGATGQRETPLFYFYPDDEEYEVA